MLVEKYKHQIQSLAVWDVTTLRQMWDMEHRAPHNHCGFGSIIFV